MQSKIKKRKSVQSNDDESSKAKVSKKSDTINETEIVEKFVEEADNEDDKEDHINYTKEFKIIDFRKKLKGYNFIPELRNFLHLASTKPRIIEKFINKHGKPLEIIEAFNRIDKSHLYHVSYLCDALQLILLEIATNAKSHSVHAINASRYFLKSHSDCIAKLLNSANIKHRQIILKLLTAIVCIEPKLGRQILGHFDIFTNYVQLAEHFSHSKTQVTTNTDETLRKTFINFTLAYLIDGNIQLVRNLLEKINVFKVLLSGLICDDAVTVSVVFEAVRKNVIENLEISKSTKHHVFDIHCVRKLTRLYEWCGANYQIKQTNKKKMTIEENVIEENLDANQQEDRNVVRCAVHQFLIILLTSRKYGIAFDSMKFYKVNRNSLQGQLLGSINKPWEDDLKIELITKILISCPELARKTVKHYGTCLNPLKTGLKYWIKMANFMEQMIKALHPNILRQGMNQITLTDYSYWIREICFSSEMCIHLKGKLALKHPEYEVRIATVRLLLTMYRQFCNYMQIIMDREKNKQNNDLRRFKLTISTHVFVNFPTIDNILVSLFLSINRKDDCDVLTHLDLTFDLILLMIKQYRSFVMKTGLIIDYIKLLEPIYLMNGNDESNFDLELKCVKTILYLMPNALKPNEEIFQNILQSFLKIYVCGSDEHQIEVGQLLRKILLNTKFFENGILEIDIWLEALKMIDLSILPIICYVFVECFQCNPDKIHFDVSEKEEITTVNMKNIHGLFESIEGNITIEGYIETPIMSKLLPLICQKIKITEKLQSYLDIIGFLLFHYVPDSESVYQFYIDNFTKHQDYMSTWLVNKNFGKLSKSVNAIPYYKEIYTEIKNGNETFLKIFTNATTENSFIVRINDDDVFIKNEFKNERLLMIYINQMLFITTQLSSDDNLTDDISKSLSNFMTGILQILFHLNSVKMNTTFDYSETDKEMINLSLLETVLKYIYCNQVNLLQNFNIFKQTVSTKNLLNLIYDITNCCQQFDLDNFENIVVHYRMKIVQQISLNISETISSKCDDERDYSVVIKMLECFKMSEENCLKILENLMQLPHKNFAEINSIYLNILMYVMNRYAELKKSMIDVQIIEKLTTIYCNIDVNLEKLEESLTNFLQISHQSIVKLPTNFFLAILQSNQISKSKIRLITLLLERNDNLNEIFLNNVLASNFTKELIYPLFAISKDIIKDKNVLINVYQECKSGIMKTIEKPQKAGTLYKENILTTLYLIKHCMPLNECLDFCRKNLKIDTVEVYQLRAINEIFVKAIESVDKNNENQYMDIFMNFLNTFIQLYSTLLRRDNNYDVEKFTNLNYAIFKWIEKYHCNLKYDFSKITSSQLWMTLCKNCLKTGMNEIESDNFHANDINNSSYLKILALLCQIMYDNNSNHSDCEQLFEMIFSHSRFFEIILTSKLTQVKNELLNLILQLVQKNINMLHSKHIPIYLGAYNAKLSNCDRYILAILQIYEMNSISLHEYRPFIWGESAIEHYSLRNQDDEIMNLENQELSISQVMSLIDVYICENTLQHFPIWRKLNTIEQLPKIQFDDPNTTLNKFGNNILEMEIEQGKLEFDKSFLKLCPRKENWLNECYDPAFFIPLMNMSFAAENFARPIHALQNGFLGIVFAALSSLDKDMRLAAGCAQLRYRQQFENIKFSDKQIWQQAYDNIQNGLNNLQTDRKMNKKNNGIARMPYISALFLAKSFNLLLNPIDPLYKTLTEYLNVKESFNFTCVPEFNVLFHSSEIEHNHFREFILTTIRDGITCSDDLLLLYTTNTFKALLGFYLSTMSNFNINLLILSIVSVCVKIPMSIKLMTEHVGIISWLNLVIENVEYFQYDTIEIIISIISNLWYSVKAKQQDFHNFKYIEENLFDLLVKLSSHITGQITLTNFTRFLNILEKTSYDKPNAVSNENLQRLLISAQRHFPNDIWYMENIKIYGGDCVESKVEYYKKLIDRKFDKISIQALSSLREFIIKWTVQQ